MMKILVTPTSLRGDTESEALDELKRFADEVVFNPYGHPLSAEELLPLLSGADGYIAGLDYITESVIEKAPSSLRVISRYGVGCERVDVKAAARRGIVVTNTPGVNAESVADLVFGLLLSLARSIPSLDRRIRNAEWPRTSGVELFEKKMGILGLGAVGRGVARRARGFSMQVFAYDPYLDRRYASENGIKECTLPELLSRCDFISLHLPLNDGTRNIIDRAALSLIKPGAILINTARGGLIDEDAAYDALKNGSLGGLGLDAFEKEPPGESKLFTLNNVVATPHAGAHTAEAVGRMTALSVKNLIDVLSGRDCPYVIKP